MCLSKPKVPEPIIIEAPKKEEVVMPSPPVYAEALPAEKLEPPRLETEDKSTEKTNRKVNRRGTRAFRTDLNIPANEGTNKKPGLQV